MRPYRRARREEEKTDRVEAILASAASLLADNTLDECNLSTIAGEVGITKAALYRYFRVKELIFLEIYRRELALLAPALQQVFLAPSVEKLAAALVARPLFCKLTAVLADVLEKPLTEEEAVTFKSYILQVFEPLGIQLNQQFGMSLEQVIGLLLHIFSAIVGCWKISHPSPMMTQALQNEQLAPFRADFHQYLQQHLTMLLGQIIPAN
jgi:AcrR family transcriptional regulator